MTRKTTFLGLALGTNLKFYTSLAKWLKLKVKEFSGLISTFIKVIGGKLVGRAFLVLKRTYVNQKNPIIKWSKQKCKGQESFKKSQIKANRLSIKFCSTLNTSMQQVLQTLFHNQCLIILLPLFFQRISQEQQNENWK